jgi:hypothetical protein
MTKKESFAHAAEIEHRVVPGSVMLHEGIMTPQQRRERLHFETDHIRATRALHRADMNDRRLHQIMYVSAVVGVLHSESDETCFALLQQGAARDVGRSGQSALYGRCAASSR